MQVFPMALETRFRPAPTLILTGAAACVAGLVAHGVWQELPAARFGESLMLAAIATLLAWPLRALRGWAWADALALVWVVALVVMTGVVPVLAVGLLVAGACALGGRIAGNARPVLALLAGFALIAGVLGWLLPLPGHRPWLYASVLALAALAGRRALVSQFAVARDGWREAVRSAPRAAAVGVVVLGLASSGAWLPTMQYDDLAYHLGLPWQLMLHGRYALDPTHQVWALAPWAGDVLQAVPQVIARTEARGPLNAVWLLAAVGGLWRLGATLGLDAAWRWGVLALYASLPPVLTLLSGMQTETPAVAVTLALAGLVFAPRDRSDLLVAGLLFGLLAALKPVHAIAAAPLLVLAAWRYRRSPVHLPVVTRVALATLLATAVAASSYAYAWIMAGNPLLPLFNAHFRSPYFAPVDFDDPRWHAGFGPALPWRMTFATDAYYEAWPGGFGFVLVALAGAWPVALWMPRTRALAVVASVAMLLPLVPLQYARYALPGLVLLLPALVAAMRAGLSPRVACALLAGVCMLDVAYQANANWIIHTRAVKRTVIALGRDDPLLAHYAPERVLAERIRRQAPQAIVLDLSGPSIAEYAGRGRTLAWYDPRLQAAARDAESDASGRGWTDVLRRSGAREVVVRPAALTPSQRAGLTASGATPVATVGDAQWWHLPETVR